MFPTDGTLLTVSPDDAQPSAVVDDNILTDDEMPPSSGEESNEVPADYSALPETLMTSNAENEGKSAPEAETVDKTTPTLSSSDQQKVSNEPTGIEEEFQDENQEVQVLSEDNVSTEVDTSCAEKATATINEERQEEIIDERTDAEGCVDDTFVSVELSSSPSKNNSSYEEVGGQQEQEPLIDAASVSNTAAATVLINPSSEVAATDAAMASYVSSDNNDDVAAALKSSLNISSSQPPTTTTTTTTTTRRRKILHHPILSHLTKLPWDRLSNAGSACDVLFNCKYSMKQVEDEVREECRRGVSGEGVYIENDGVGREDGYVNVSLNSCSDYQYQEEGCEAGEFEQILGCCSMLDNDEETDEEEEDVECVLPENNVVASEKAPYLVQPMIGLEGSHATVYTNQEGGEEEREYSGDNRVNSSSNELQQQQQSEKSWQQANPSLDMMLYRQFLNE
mmetsp:Transcript_1584/g.2361  ORF Transcript_1584/g.2361 Transcript_1584/m.2361 type:complete len:452 (+) Transcript_1584:191-1546(+)|eukprot:scaffold4725_cov140-Skeletonema_dohrnii-CCMP3373.AAC.9